MKRQRAILVIVSLFFIASPAVAERQISKADFIKDVNVLFLREDYAALIRSVEDNLRQCRLAGKEKKSILYLEGLAYLKTGGFDKARDIFSNITEMHGGEYKEEAYIGIADSYFDEGKFDKAIESYEFVLDMFSRSPRLSSVYYRLALAYKKKNDPDKANFYFKKIEKNYGSSFEADKIGYVNTQEDKPLYYIIQLGAFKNLKNAKKVARTLARKGYSYYIQKVTQYGKNLYRVRAGKFSSKIYALKLQKKLRRDKIYAELIME
ncbi:MAG: SPOR domain-containing protein [Candidatus Omnitrophica bacterium]|nr:SPOR domain-containing protein [Candidatus Omnitrophota bacterium]